MKSMISAKLLSERRITAVWFFAELFVLKKNVFKHAVDRFETLYMKKLQDAYTEGDVKEDD